MPLFRNVSVLPSVAVFKLPVGTKPGEIVNVALLLDCPDTVTTTFSVVVPPGTGTLIEVALQLAGVTAIPLNATVLVPCVDPKLLPVMVNEVPTAPEAGAKPLILGVDRTVNNTPLLDAPFTVTTMFPVVAPVGTGTVIEVAFQLVGLAAVPLNVTAPVVPKLVPLMVTVAPTDPEVGDTLVTTGPITKLTALVHEFCEQRMEWHRALPRFALRQTYLATRLSATYVDHSVSDKTRRVMSLVYKHGQRYGLTPRNHESNPMRFVRCKTTSGYEAMILTPNRRMQSSEYVPALGGYTRPCKPVLYERCQASSRPHARSRKGESRRTLSECFLHSNLNLCIIRRCKEYRGAQLRSARCCSSRPAQ